MKKKKPAWRKILPVVLLLVAAACVWEFFSSQNPYILPVRRALKYDVLRLSPVNERLENSGFDATENAFPTLYVDGKASAGGKYVRGADNKRVIETAGTTRLVNYLDGYQLDFPAGTAFDFSLSPLFTRAYGEGWDAVISRERATYAGMKDVIRFELSTFFPFLRSSGVRDYVDHYELRFLESADWQANNRVRLDLHEVGSNKAELLRATLLEAGDAAYDAYLYAFVYTGSREYLRIAVRCSDGDAAYGWLRDSLSLRLRAFDPTGVGHYDADYSPDLDAGALSPEARALYDDLVNGDTLLWGVYTADIFSDPVHGSVARLEEELDYGFDAALGYIHFDRMPDTAYPTRFPTEFMEANRQKGRVVELTYQLTANDNQDMFAHTPFLDVYRGERDDTIREFARAAADWGHPFLLRLNNEMNSDWTSWSGVVNMADPQLYVAVWQRMYRIFREEGADNCLWVFNPNDRSAPPCKWNASLAYYPGNEYVQLLGVTGYNNGTYYTRNNEQWRGFTAIYDEVWALYSPHFSRFPWIITEFASSSYGGDKAAWIDEMFAHIGDYPNIRIAVWFSAADYDGEIAARPYWLDETPETLAAFRRGLHGG